MSGRRTKTAIKLIVKGYKVILPNSDESSHQDLYWILWMQARNRVSFPLTQYNTALDINSSTFSEALHDILQKETVAVLDTTKALDNLRCM